MATSETAFLTWQADARRLDTTRLPDVQIPLMALVGVYSCIVGLPKNVYAFRKTVIGDKELCRALSEVIPGEMRYEFDDDEAFQIDIVRPGANTHARDRWEGRMLIDGLPGKETMITSREYFLTRFLGQTAYNYAINVEPLRLDLQFARPPLHDHFPRSLSLIEATT